MKAAVFYDHGGPDVLRYETVPDPVCPPYGIAIDVAAISLEGGDLIHRATLATPPRTPHIVGYACAGTVREVGPVAQNFAVGDRVVTVGGDGSHATMRVVPAPLAWKIPAGLDPQVAACVPVAFGTAHECLLTAGGLRAGQTVLIHGGAGGVGMAAIQIAKRTGARVIATASSADKLDRLRALGLDDGIDYVRNDFVAEVRRLTSDRGVDLVLDTVGGKTLAASVDALAYRGRLVSVGVAAREGSSIDAFGLWSKNLSLHGVNLNATMQAELPRLHQVVGDYLSDAAAGRIRVVVDRTFPLAEAAAAHSYGESRKAFGRIVLLA